MKVLILSCNTGEGHNSSANSLYEKLMKEKVPCEFKDTLTFYSLKLSKKISKIYTWITTKSPPLFNIAYKAGKLLSSSNRKSPIYYANRKYADSLYSYICANDFDCIVCFHLFPAEALTFIREKYGLKILCIAVATDYTCIPFWEETNMDYYIVGHELLREEFSQKGININKIIPLGIPVNESFLIKNAKNVARKKLDLKEKRDTILIMTGSMGFGKVDKVIKNLLDNYNEKINIVVLCGKNKKLIEKLRYLFQEYTNVYLREYTKLINLYLDASDVLFTKPGGLTSTEAAVKNIPIIHMAEIPGCETKNREFFNKLKISYYLDKSENASKMVAEILDFKKSFIIENQKKEINRKSTEDLYLFIQNNVMKANLM